MDSKTAHRHRPASPASLHVGVMSENSEAAIWSRLIDPQRDDLTEDAARSLLRMSFRDQDRQRAQELTEKNKEAALTPSERAELEDYCRVGRLLDLMHSKARRSLKRLSAS